MLSAQEGGNKVEGDGEVWDKIWITRASGFVWPGEGPGQLFLGARSSSLVPDAQI